MRRLTLVVHEEELARTQADALVHPLRDMMDAVERRDDRLFAARLKAFDGAELDERRGWRALDDKDGLNCGARGRRHELECGGHDSGRYIGTQMRVATSTVAGRV